MDRSSSRRVSPVRHSASLLRLLAGVVRPGMSGCRSAASRWVSLLTALTVVLTLATQSASSFTTAQAQERASLQTPQQLSGTAAGRSHRASAASTTARSASAGGQHRLGKGELAALAAARGVGPARSSDATRATLQASRTVIPATARRQPHEPVASGKDATASVGVPGPAQAGSEIVSQRTATTSVFQNPDGTRTMRVYSRPVHYKQANGAWGDINTSLVRQSAGGRWQEKANAQLPSFAAVADDPQLVSIALDSTHSVAYGLQGAAPVAAKVSGGTVTYPNALPSADVVYNAQAAGVKESLILHSASAPTRWVFPLQFKGLTPSLDSHGDVVFTDSAGKVLLTIPRGFMEDSAVNPVSGDGATSTGMTYSLTAVDGIPALVMTLDASWLHARGRVFPVTVDPTSDFQQNVDTSAYVDDTNGTVVAGGNASYVGNLDDDLLKVGSYESGQEANSYLWFSSIGSSVLMNDYIENVGVALDETWAAQCAQHEVDVDEITSSWSPDKLNSFPGVSIGAQIGKGTFAAGSSCSNGTQWEPIDLGDSASSAGIQLVQSWAHGGANYGLALTADDSDTTAWKQFASFDSNFPPYMYITYSPYGASYAPAGSYTAPTYSVNGSESVTLTNTGATAWPSGSTVLKADVYDSSGHQIAIANEPSVAVPATSANGTATVTGVLPALPASDVADTACWDVYVGGVSLNQSYNVTPTCVAFAIQDTAPSITLTDPPSNTTVGELSPQFYATGNDPDNYPGKGLEYEFQVYTNPSTGSPALVVDSGWVSSGSWQVPVGNLLWNTSYLWQVRVSDFDAPGLWSNPALFSTTVQQPLMTGQLGNSSDASSGRTFDPLSGDYTTQATDAKVNVVGPALQVARSYNSLDPRTTGLFGAGWSSTWDMQVQPDADSSGGVVVTQADGQQERFGRNDFALTQTTSVGAASGGTVDDVVAVDHTDGSLYLYRGPGYGGATRQGIARTWEDPDTGNAVPWSELTDLTGGDLTGSGLDDLLAVDPGTGKLWEFAGHPTWTCSTRVCPDDEFPTGAPFSMGPTQIGAGTDWRTMSNLAVVPSLDGGTGRDLIAVQTSTGDLYAYPINSTGGLGTGAVIGDGWGVINQLVGGTFDGKPGIVGIDTSTGALLLYPSAGTSSLSTSTLGASQELSSGWGQKTNLAAINGISGDSGTDISATDTVTGITYLYHQATSFVATGRTDLGMDIYTPPAGVYQDLFHQSDGSWLLRDKDGTTYTFGAPGTPTGKLSQIADNDGHTQVLAYVNGQLATVTDSTSGRALHVTWNAAGTHVASVSTDPVTSGGTNPLTWNYTYNTSTGGNPDELDQVCAPPTGGNTAASCTIYSYTSGTSSGSHFRTTVMDANPSSYWRLGEASGTDTAASQVAANEGNDNATYSNVTLGSAAGPLAGSPTTAATFNGTTSAVTLPTEALKDTYLAVGLWFKTSSPGILMEEQNQALTSSTTPSHAAPVLYVGTDGLLRGEFYGSAIGNSPITTTTKVDDGNWHYAVLTGAGNAQTLYLDGTPVSSSPLLGAIGHLDMSYTSVGAGYTKGSSWPSAPAANASGRDYFNGQIAEVALYQHSLGTPAIAEQYASAKQAATELTGITLPTGKQGAAMTYDPVNDRVTQVTDTNGGTWKVNDPTVSGSTQEYRASVMGSQPSGYWRLSDGSGTEAANQIYAARPTPNNGTYSNVTLGAAGPLASGSGTAATFDGATSWLQLPDSNIPTQGPASISLWFKTTTAGVLFSYQSFPVGSAHSSSDQWNPALYVGTDGYLHGKLFTDATTMTSTTAVNDGKWHFAVLDATSTTSQTLYLDGAVAAGPLAGTITPNGTGYAYVGAGTADGWLDAPSDPDGHFDGQIADVAVFPSGLTAGEISTLETTAQTVPAPCTGTPCSGAIAAFSPDQSLYSTAIIDDHPQGYWPLDDASGNQASETLSSTAAQLNQGTYSATTGGASGPWASGTTTATSLNGTSSYVQLPGTVEPTSGPASVEIWFKTSSPGVLYSYQSMPLGTAPNGSTDRWNPTLYVGTDGQLHGEFMTGTPTPAVSTSTTAVDNGAWHMAALVATGDSQQLYLDGAATGTPITGGIVYNGQGNVYLGAGNDTGGWPDAPSDTSGHLNGSLADFATYDYALGASAIAGQYSAATTAGNGTGMDAATAYRAQVVQDVPTDYWRLDDATGSPYAQDELGTSLPDPYAGTYSNATLNVAGGPAGALDGAASFNGTSSSVQLPDTAAPVTGAGSIELWFKTAGPGVLYAYQSMPLGTAAVNGSGEAWNPGLYVGTDDKLHGLFLDETSSTADQLTSTGTVTDDKWHQVVLSATGTAETLYLDGTQQGTESGHTLQFNGDAYVYLGAGAVSSAWPDAPAGDSTSTDYLNGSLAEAAYYSSALSATTVLAHYKAMASSTNPTPVTTVTVTDPGGNTLSYQYDTTTEQLLAYTDAYGDTTRYSYDTNGFLQTVTDPDGHTTTTGHDARGNTVSTTTCRNASSCQTSYATFYLNLTNGMDPQNDELQTSSDARSASSTDTTYTTSYTYDATGHLTGVTTPSGRSESTTYTAGTETAVGGGTEPAGLPAANSDWDPTHAKTTYSYYSNGDLAQTVSPLGLKTSYTYDNLGRVLTKTAISDTYPNGLVTSYTWDGQGQPLTQTDPATTEAPTGKVVHTQQTSYTYDADGDTLTQVVADLTGGDTARTTSWQYNTGDDQVKQVTDPAGRTTQYTYDAYGNVASMTDGAGTVYDYTYSPMGQLQQTAIANYTGDPTNPVSSRQQVTDSRAYDPAGRLASDTDAMGRTTSYFYNDDNTLAEVDLTGFHNADGTIRNVVEQQDTYDNAGNLIQQVTGGGNSTTDATYDVDGRQTSTTLDPGGLDRVTSYTLDPNSNVTADKLTGGGQSRETDYTYNAAGDPLSQTVVNTPQNSTTTWTYDERGLPLTQVAPDGNATGATASAYTTYYTYDPLGQLTQTDAPAVTTHAYSTSTNTDTTGSVARVTTTGYDTFGDVTSTDDPDGNLSTYTYNPDGQQTAAAEPAYTAPGTSTPVNMELSVAYDGLGREISSTLDPDGQDQTTTTKYDQLGDPVQITKPTVNGTTPTEHTSYDLDSEPLQVTDPTGAVTDNTYDDLGRLSTTTQVVRQPTQAAYTTSYTYDDAGDQLSVTPPAPEGTSRATYDAAGEMTTSTDPLLNTTDYSYDLAGDLTGTTLPDKTATQASYNQAGQLTAVTPYSKTGTALPGTTATYDPDGNQLTSTDADNHTANATYNAADELIQEVQPVASGNSITTAFGYDLDGNRTLYTDGNGQNTYYTYNTLGLPESTIDPATTADTNPADRTYTMAYDSTGHPSTYNLPGGVAQTFTYDADGNLTSQGGTGGDTPTATRTFTYDADGHQLTAATPSGTETYAYQDGGSLLSASGPTANSSYSYNADGELASRTDQTGTTSFGYDMDGRVATTADPLTGTTATNSYDNVGDLQSTSYGSGAPTRSYTYDDEHRLLSDTLTLATGTTEASSTYTYDADGNTLTQNTTGLAGSGSNSYSYDYADRLTSWNNGTANTGYSYDGNGNLTQSGSTTASYNQRNQLTSLGTTSYTYSPRGTRTTASTSGGSTTNYSYDAFGQQTAAASQTYTYDADGRLATVDGKAMVYDGNSDSLVSDGTQTYTRGSDDTLLAIGSGTSSALALNDQHNDLVGTFTTAGTSLTSSTAYDPWGQPVATSGSSNDIGYQGGWTDPTTGQVNTASRWYNPATADFTSRDTTPNTSTTSAAGNLYTYANDNPLTNSDTSGDSACGDEDDSYSDPASSGDGGDGGDGTGDGYSGYGEFSSPDEDVARDFDRELDGDDDENGAPKAGDNDNDNDNDNDVGGGRAMGEPGSGGDSDGGGFVGGEGSIRPVGEARVGISVQLNEDQTAQAVLATASAAADQSCGGDVSDAPPPPSAQEGLERAPDDPRPTTNSGPTDPTEDNTVYKEDPNKQGTTKTDPLRAAGNSNAKAKGSTYDPNSVPNTSNTGSSVTNDTVGSQGDDPSGKCSFSADTRVLMAGDKKTEPIGQIKPGEQVESANPNTGKEEGARAVQVVWANHDTDLLDVTVSTGHGHTATIHTTSNHPFWDSTRHAWVAAAKLKPGDRLATTNTSDQPPTVDSIKITPGAATRYNLTVQQLHTYYVLAGTTPILVHNTDGGCPTFVNNAMSSLPQKVTSGRIFDASGSEIGPAISSGTDDTTGPIDDFLRQSSDIETPRAGPHPSATHVETKYAWWMMENDVTDADVVINNPRGACPFPFGCQASVPAILPEGSTMRVWYPGATEPQVLEGLG